MATAAAEHILKQKIKKKTTEVRARLGFPPREVRILRLSDVQAQSRRVNQLQNFTHARNEIQRYSDAIRWREAMSLNDRLAVTLRLLETGRQMQ